MTAERIEQMKARLKREDEEKEKAFQRRLEEIRESQAFWRAEQEAEEHAEEQKRKKRLVTPGRSERPSWGTPRLRARPPPAGRS